MLCLTNWLSTNPEEWRNFNTRIPISACRLKRDGLKRLYRMLDDRQKEYRDRAVSVLQQQPNESQVDFERRRTNVGNAFVISVTIQMENGERLTGNPETIFDQASLSPRIRSVFYSSVSVPSAVLQHTPVGRVTVFLDFSHPPALDFRTLPTLPTPNESNLEISANSESWFAATKARLTEFFDENRSGYEWIHHSGIYDVLLVFLGLPLAVWACVKLEKAAPSIDALSVLPRSLMYAYTFILTLTLFRILFSYSRWVFPKVEIETDARRTPLRHRAAWVFVLLAVLSPAIYDLAKAGVGYVLESK